MAQIRPAVVQTLVRTSGFACAVSTGRQKKVVGQFNRGLVHFSAASGANPRRLTTENMDLTPSVIKLTHYQKKGRRQELPDTGQPLRLARAQRWGFINDAANPYRS